MANTPLRAKVKLGWYMEGTGIKVRALKAFLSSNRSFNHIIKVFFVHTHTKKERRKKKIKSGGVVSRAWQ